MPHRSDVRPGREQGRLQVIAPGPQGRAEGWPGLVGALFLAVTLATYVVWGAVGVLETALDPLTIAALLTAAALSQQLAVRVDERTSYTVLTPVIVLAAILGGPLVAGACALAPQLARRRTRLRGRLVEVGLAGMQAVLAGLVATIAHGTPPSILLASALALLVATVVSTVGRAILLVERRTRATGSPLLRGLVLDLAECVVATPLVAVLAVVAVDSKLLALTAVGAVLLTLGLARRARSSSATALAAERAAARRDQLTGAPNRRAFEEALAMEQARVARGDSAAGLFIVDIDRFKSINDRFGHPVGDEVLIAVVDRLREGLRACDMVARWGGEEITVLAPGIRSVEGLTRFGERIRRLVGTLPVTTKAHAIPISVSVGGTFLDASTTPHLAMRTADGALYDAKRTRDTSVVAMPPRQGLLLDDRRRRTAS